MNPRPSEMDLSEDDLAALNSDPVPDDRWKYYTILQVPRSATTHEIEQSYRRLSKVFHTDRLVRKLKQQRRDISQAEVDRYTASARLTMSLVNQAKAVLTDPVRRAAYDKHGDDGLAAFESLDVAVRDSASPSEILAMLDILKGSKRQHDADVKLGTSGAVIMLVDATDFVDAAIAKWLTGRRGLAANELLALEQAEADFSDVEWPFCKAVTVQHVAQAYASESLNVSLGAALQGSHGLSGGRAFATVAYAITPRDTIQCNLAITEASTVAFEVGAARQINPATSVEAAIKTDSSDGGGPGLSLRSRRKIDARGTWVSAEADLVSDPVYIGGGGGEDGEEGSEGVKTWEGRPGGVALSMGGVIERDPRTDRQKSTIEVAFRPPVGRPMGGSATLTRVITSKCKCSVIADVDEDAGWDVEIQSSFQFSPISRLTVGASVGARGVKMKINFLRGRSTFRLPLMLASRPSSLVFAFAAAAPVAALLLGRWFSLPYHAMLSASWRKDKKDASQTDWSQKLDHVQRQQQLLERTAELSKDAESEKGGLVIIEARYGCHSRSRDDWLDVRVVLQAAVQDSRIVIPGGSTKRDLQGFLDPRDRPRGSESESDSDDSDESVGAAGASAEERARAQRRRMRRLRRRQNRRFDDRPPRRLLPRMMWILRHFFALPSVSRQSIQDTESEQNSDDNQMPQFVLNADGDEETPVDDALVLAVRYSYRGHVYDIEFPDLAEVLLPNPTLSRRVWTEGGAAPRRWAQ